MHATKTSYITCPLCEATCVLEVVTKANAIESGISVNIEKAQKV